MQIDACREDRIYGVIALTVHVAEAVLNFTEIQRYILRVLDVFIGIAKSIGRIVEVVRGEVIFGELYFLDPGCSQHADRFKVIDNVCIVTDRREGGCDFIQAAGVVKRLFLFG